MANELTLALADIEAVAKKVLEGIAPVLENMVGIAVNAALPPTVAPAASAVIDTIDSLVNANNPSILNAAAAPGAAPAPAPVVTSQPTNEQIGATLASLTQQVMALTAHVAALTISTGANTSQAFQSAKASVQATQTAQLQAVSAPVAGAVAVAKAA